LHGYGVTLRIEQVSDDVLRVNQEPYTVAPAAPTAWLDLVGMGHVREQHKAKYYAISNRCRKQLAAEAEDYRGITMPTITVKLDKKRADRLARWARRSKVQKSDVIGALIDRAGPIETGDDLIEWVEAATGKGLGLAQKKP
jgi:hypothetical protein